MAVLGPKELNAMRGVRFNTRPLPQGNAAGVSPEANALWTYCQSKVTDAGGAVIMERTEKMTLPFAKKIEDFLSDQTHLDQWFGGKRPTDVKMAEKCGFKKSTWDRLSNATQYLDVERGNVFAIGIGLHLDERQMEELLLSCGFSLNEDFELDRTVLFFIRQGVYDIKKIKEVLSEFCDVSRGLDNFTFSPAPQKPKAAKEKKE